MALAVLATFCCGLVSSCQSPSAAAASAANPPPEDTAAFLPPDVASASSRSPESSEPVGPRPALSTPVKPEDFARWERDPARAKRKSELLNRPLLVLFTGLSWSSNARLLGEEVFLSKSFNTLAREHLTLLYLDFPQNPSDAPPEVQRFKNYYEVKGLPSVIILTSDGKIGYRRTGYAPGKAQDYFKELEKAVLGLRKQSLSIR